MDNSTRILGKYVWILVDVDEFSTVGIPKSVKTVEDKGGEILPYFSTDELAKNFVQESKMVGVRPLKRSKPQFIEIRADFEHHLRGEHAKLSYNPAKLPISGQLQSFEDVIALFDD